MSDDQVTSITFTEAKAIANTLNAAVDVASSALKAFPKGEMGLTPDEVRSTEAWKLAKKSYDEASNKLRNFNRMYVKVFKKELREDRRKRFSNE